MKWWAASTLTQAKFLQVSTVLVIDTQEMLLHNPLAVQHEGKSIETKGLIDCGAKGNFVDKDFITKNRVPTFQLKESIKAKNMDGSLNRKGEITHVIWLPTEIGGAREMIQFYRRVQTCPT